MSRHCQAYLPSHHLSFLPDAVGLHDEAVAIRFPKRVERVCQLVSAERTLRRALCELVGKRRSFSSCLKRMLPDHDAFGSTWRSIIMRLGQKNRECRRCAYSQFSMAWSQAFHTCGLAVSQLRKVCAATEGYRSRLKNGLAAGLHKFFSRSNRKCWIVEYGRFHTGEQ
jgi:hypothetical protein